MGDGAGYCQVLGCNFGFCGFGLVIGHFTFLRKFWGIIRQTPGVLEALI